MGTKRKKTIELTIEMKKKVLDLIDKGDSQRKSAEAFSIANSTVGNISKNRSEILRAWNENCCNIPVSGPMLQSKAKEIAEKLGKEKLLDSLRRISSSGFRSGKLAKERLTVLACCSSTREKLKPLDIGNAEHPRVFKANGVDPKNPPIIWRSNKKAWKTGNLFEEWLTDLNQQMKKSNRKILLLVDNATSHNGTKILSRVTVKFLSPSLTSEVQPLDQGVIPETISKCFQRSGFKERTEGIDEDKDVGLAEVINSFSPEIQNDVLSVAEIDNADAELILHEEIPTSHKPQLMDSLFKV
ncbi:tigger transposable element-derived protein 6-like [Belonocnema kinseyi]|uniref:tigger transposable element-derived protein 6-like n=1 Tax=Belonocnema kinseyi TaxID=2817044 RepID=UPI00143DC8D1|nr:tigger transposable element-derived protein 6-like [Belonocnema kinseyi]